MEARLAERDYLCGPGRGAYSLADLACWGYAASFFWSGHDTEIEGWPSLRRWLDRIGAREAVLAGARVAAVPLLGPTGVLFEDMRTSPRVQEPLTFASARALNPARNLTLTLTLTLTLALSTLTLTL